MRSFKLLSLLFITLLFFSCGKDLPELEGMDLKVWRDDKNACNGKRSEMISTIKLEKEKLLALNQMQIVELLGRPDQNELYKRNQKFFYYFLKPAKSCALKSDSVKTRLVIRFNAMGLAKEVAIE